MLHPISYLFPDRDEFSIQVLHAFVELHEFTDLNLVQALRWVLSAGPVCCLTNVPLRGGGVLVTVLKYLRGQCRCQ